MPKYSTKGRGILRRTGNLIDQRSVAKFHLIKHGDPYVGQNEFESELKSDILTDSASTAKESRTDGWERGIYAEALVILQSCRDALVIRHLAR